MTPSKVGLVGLGIMGQGMAGRLAKSSSSSTTSLSVWNRTRQKSIDFAQEYSHCNNVFVSPSPAALAQDSDTIFSMLSTAQASREVFMGKNDNTNNGLLAGLRPGSNVIVCSTIDVDTMRDLQCAVTERGCRFLEAPVSGSRQPAANGQLVFICSGSRDLYNELVDNGTLANMSKSSYYLGETIGLATQHKLVLNAVMATVGLAYAEGLALSSSLDLDSQQFVDIVNDSAMASPMFSSVASRILNKDYLPAQAPLKHAHKDLELAKQLWQHAKVRCATLENAERVYRESRYDVDLKIADSDFTALYEKITKR